MNSEEYANLDRVERDHWYYSGKRRFVREWIRRIRPPVPSDVLLDCGAGTGRFAEEMAALCAVRGRPGHSIPPRRSLTVPTGRQAVVQFPPTRPSRAWLPRAALHGRRTKAILTIRHDLSRTDHLLR